MTSCLTTPKSDRGGGFGKFWGLSHRVGRNVGLAGENGGVRLGKISASVSCGFSVGRGSCKAWIQSMEGSVIGGGVRLRKISGSLA